MKGQGNPFRSPPIAALSDFRVSQSAPFSKVGIDFAGPLFVKCKTGEIVKSYLVADLIPTTFLRCLGRALCP